MCCAGVRGAVLGARGGGVFFLGGGGEKLTACVGQWGENLPVQTIDIF